jgi:hypothetical protein
MDVTRFGEHVDQTVLADDDGGPVPIVAAAILRHADADPTQGAPAAFSPTSHRTSMPAKASGRSDATACVRLLGSAGHGLGVSVIWMDLRLTLHACFDASENPLTGRPSRPAAPEARQDRLCRRPARRTSRRFQGPRRRMHDRCNSYAAASQPVAQH